MENDALSLTYSTFYTSGLILSGLSGYPWVTPNMRLLEIRCKDINTNDMKFTVDLKDNCESLYNFSSTIKESQYVIDVKIPSRRLNSNMMRISVRVDCISGVIEKLESSGVLEILHIKNPRGEAGISLHFPRIDTQVKLAEEVRTEKYYISSYGNSILSDLSMIPGNEEKTHVELLNMFKYDTLDTHPLLVKSETPIHESPVSVEKTTTTKMKMAEQYIPVTLSFPENAIGGNIDGLVETIRILSEYRK